MRSTRCLLTTYAARAASTTTSGRHGLTRCLAEPLLQDITPLAVEQPLVNTIKRVGGTPDAIFVKGDDIYIADLKTVSKKEGVSSRKEALPQLGAYLEFAASCYPACTSPSW